MRATTPNRNLFRHCCLPQFLFAFSVSSVQPTLDKSNLQWWRHSSHDWNIFPNDGRTRLQWLTLPQLTEHYEKKNNCQSSWLDQHREEFVLRSPLDEMEFLWVCNVYGPWDRWNFHRSTIDSILFLNYENVISNLPKKDPHRIALGIGSQHFDSFFLETNAFNFRRYIDWNNISIFASE